jgi:Flp pilus assembly protein TadD
VPRANLPLLGAGITLLLTAAAGTAWLALRSPEADAAAEGPPARAESAAPRLSDSPQYERCLELLRDDPEDAFRFAEGWDAAGGGEAAKHCAALALLGLSEADRAAERLEALAARSPAPAAIRAGLFAQAGQAWTMAGQPNRAFAAATMGLTLAPDDPDLLLDRAIALASMGRNAEALEDLDRTVAVDPRRVEAWVLRGAALRRLDRGREAERDIEKALALSADHVEALLERGIQRQLRGQTAAARADWERVVALAPDSAAADLALQNLALSEAGPQRR